MATRYPQDANELIPCELHLKRLMDCVLDLELKHAGSWQTGILANMKRRLVTQRLAISRVVCPYTWGWVERMMEDLRLITAELAAFLSDTHKSKSDYLASINSFKSSFVPYVPHSPPREDPLPSSSPSSCRSSVVVDCSPPSPPTTSYTHANRDCENPGVTDSNLSSSCSQESCSSSTNSDFDSEVKPTEVDPPFNVSSSVVSSGADTCIARHVPPGSSAGQVTVVGPFLFDT